MKLYYSKGACSFAVHVIIKELNLSCEFEAVNLKTKITASGVDFRQINPKGAVPALETDDHEILTENIAIQQYLAEKAQAVQLLPIAPNIQRYRIIEWLSFIATDLHKSCGALFVDKIPNELKQTIFIPLLQKKLQYTDKALHNHNYLLGDQFTLPDAYLFVIISWLPNFKIDIAEYPNLQHYYTQLKKRKSILQALQEEAQ